MEKGQEDTTSLPLCQTSNHAFYTFHANMRTFWKKWRFRLAAETAIPIRDKFSFRLDALPDGVSFGTHLLGVVQVNPGTRRGLHEKITIPSLARSRPASQ
jgi:hypothetical protein